MPRWLRRVNLLLLLFIPAIATPAKGGSKQLDDIMEAIGLRPSIQEDEFEGDEGWLPEMDEEELEEIEDIDNSLKSVDIEHVVHLFVIDMMKIINKDVLLVNRFGPLAEDEFELGAEFFPDNTFTVTIPIIQRVPPNQAIGTLYLDLSYSEDRIFTPLNLYLALPDGTNRDMEYDPAQFTLDAKKRRYQMRTIDRYMLLEEMMDPDNEYDENEEEDGGEEEEEEEEEEENQKFGEYGERYDEQMIDDDEE